MSSSIQLVESPLTQGWTAAYGEEPRWYAIHTRSQHEKSVAARLESEGIETYLPLVAEIHRWSDRSKTVQMPLFSCYIFLRTVLIAESWVKVMRTRGVLRFVGKPGEGTAVPDSEIESIRKLLSSDAPYTICPFLKPGQRVRVRGGALDGIEGTLTSRNGDRTLVISVEPVQRSIAIAIGEYGVEPA